MNPRDQSSTTGLYKAQVTDRKIPRLFYTPPSLWLSLPIAPPKGIGEASWLVVNNSLIPIAQKMTDRY